MLEGLNNTLKDFWTLRTRDVNIWFVERKSGQLSKGFRERSNTLIYSGLVTPDLHALP